MCSSHHWRSCYQGQTCRLEAATKSKRGGGQNKKEARVLTLICIHASIYDRCHIAGGPGATCCACGRLLLSETVLGLGFACERPTVPERRLEKSLRVRKFAICRVFPSVFVVIFSFLDRFPRVRVAIWG